MHRTIVQLLEDLERKCCCVEEVALCDGMKAFDAAELPIQEGDETVVIEAEDGSCVRRLLFTLCEQLLSLEASEEGLNEDDRIPVLNQDGCMTKTYIGFCGQLAGLVPAETDIEVGDEVLTRGPLGECIMKTFPEISSGCCYEEVTYAAAAALIAGDDLVPNTLYKITDRGDRGIFLNAVSVNKFDQEGVRLMLVPNATELSLTLESVWHPVQGTFGIGDYAVWYGHVFQNLTGDKGTDPVTDAVNWELIPKDTFSNDEYIERAFGVIYDFGDDWISKQWDEFGNEFGIAITNEMRLNYVFGIGDDNPVNVSDWWLAAPFNMMKDNVCYGIWNNWDIDHIHDNNIRGGIFGNAFGLGIGLGHNTNQGDISNNYKALIYYNSNNGPISDNDVRGEEDNDLESGIHHNSNNGEISRNFMNGDGGKGSIVYNSNNGDISDNGLDDIETPASPQFIRFNTNNGDITNNVFTCTGFGDQSGIYKNINNGFITGVTQSGGNIDVYNNINNGDIGGAAPYAADITDTIVDK